MAAAVGRVLGNYILRSVIGRGGMSEVFAAEHRFLGQAVAIKVLRPALAADAGQAARFVDEAARTRAVEHANVVRVIDFGRDDEDGTLYLVMERLAGEDLAARLERAGRLDEAEVRRIGAAVADGMEAAHERGIIHRDLKPANILILADGHPKIVDFGIARLLAADGAATGPGMGTPHYMAPEQLTDGVVAPSVDVWALGVTLFEAATGTLPFTGFSDGRCPQLVDVPPRPAERVPLSAELELLILQCLNRRAAQRPATMREIAERLRQPDGALERATTPIAPPARRGVTRPAPPMSPTTPTTSMSPTTPTTSMSPTTPTTSMSPTTPTTSMSPTTPTTSMSPTTPTTSMSPTTPTTSTTPTPSTSPTSSTPLASPRLMTPPARRHRLTRLAAAGVLLAAALLGLWRLERRATSPTTTALSPPPPVTRAAPVVVAPLHASATATAAMAPLPPREPAADRAPPRSRHHAAHRLRSRIYGEKLD